MFEEGEIINEDIFRDDSRNDILDKCNKYSKINPNTHFKLFSEVPTNFTNYQDENEFFYRINEENKKIEEDKQDFLKKKRGPKKESGAHNKFSDDNVRRKCKHIILTSLLIQKYLNYIIIK